MLQLATTTTVVELLDRGLWALLPEGHLIKSRPVVFSVAIISRITSHHRDSHRAWASHTLLGTQRCREECSPGDEEVVVSEEISLDQTVESSKVVEVWALSRLKEEEEAWVVWVAVWEEDMIRRCLEVVLTIQPCSSSLMASVTVT